MLWLPRPSSSRNHCNNFVFGGGRSSLALALSLALAKPHRNLCHHLAQEPLSISSHRNLCHHLAHEPLSSPIHEPLSISSHMHLCRHLTHEPLSITPRTNLCHSNLLSSEMCPIRSHFCTFSVCVIRCRATRPARRATTHAWTTFAGGTGWLLTPLSTAAMQVRGVFLSVCVYVCVCV